LKVQSLAYLIKMCTNFWRVSFSLLHWQQFSERGYRGFFPCG